MLPEPMRIVLMIELAQGVIDNGGLQYFFEMDFEGHPPYSSIADDYRTIGATEAANVIEDAAERLFLFPHPEVETARRNAVLDQQRDDPASALERLSDQICGDDRIWRALDEFIQQHRADF